MVSDQETVESDDEPKNEEDIIKILVATDIHLGFNEKDPLRGEDSFTTFEEILKHAVSNEVDFILLGGDLFHENKPSVTCYHRCISLLKRYCLGDKPITIEFLSDQSKNFGHLKNPIVNYEDPNLNVSIPVFSIHGNHDDPTGANQLSAMDIIADTGLINYFGKWNDLNQVDIYPLLLKKGETKLAIYGLSHIKDERLFRLFRDKKVVMQKPPEDDWFNILVLHQNRAQNRGLKNYIPESVLPDFLNLVIWGHEHDCRLTPEPCSNRKTRISQPGSSVATSLAIGESLTKKIGLLCIYKEKFMMSEIKLNTVRPFVFKDVTITKPEGPLTVRPTEYGKEKVLQIVEEMIKDAKDLVTNESPTLPLIRLAVSFSDESLICNQIRLGQLYTDRVANPNEMFCFKVKKNVKVKRENKFDLEDVDELVGDELADNIGDLVDKYFENKNESLSVLSTKGLCEAVSRFIDRNDTDALEDIVKHQFGKTYNKLISIQDLELNEDNIDNLLEQFREERTNKNNEELAEISKLLDSQHRKKSNKTIDDVEISDDDDDNDEDVSMTSKTSNRGQSSTRPARGRGSRGPRRSRAKGRAS